MAVDERTIGDALRTMAARATPVDPDRLTRKALRGRVRRRGSRWVLGLAAAAALAAWGTIQLRPADPPDTTLVRASPPAVSLYPSPMYPTPSPTPTISGVPGIGTLPANDAEQYAKVLSCMPKGGAVHNMDGDRVLKQHGSTPDFRWLVEAEDKEGVTWLVGSLKGVVLCTPGIRGVSYPEDPQFTYWGRDAPGKLEFDGPLSVDVYDLQMPPMINPPRDGEPAFMIVGGRVTPGVKRVAVEWVNGQRGDAVLANGFFIVRTKAPKHNPSGWSPPDVRSVTAYDQNGRAIAAHDRIKWGDLMEGASDDND